MFNTCFKHINQKCPDIQSNGQKSLRTCHTHVDKKNKSRPKSKWTEMFNNLSYTRRQEK